MVCLDVVKSFHVPRGGELESAIDLINPGNQVLIHWAGATCHEAVGDHAEVVTDVPGALGFATGVSGIVGTLHLGGVGELVVNSLGGAVH